MIYLPMIFYEILFNNQTKISTAKHLQNVSKHGMYAIWINRFSSLHSSSQLPSLPPYCMIQRLHIIQLSLIFLVRKIHQVLHSPCQHALLACQHISICIFIPAFLSLFGSYVVRRFLFFPFPLTPDAFFFPLAKSTVVTVV